MSNSSSTKSNSLTEDNFFAIYELCFSVSEFTEIMNLQKSEHIRQSSNFSIITFHSTQFKNHSFKFLHTDLFSHLSSLMDLLSDYRPLSQTKIPAEVEELRNLALNPFNVTYI